MLTENPHKNPLGDCTQSKIKDSKTINKGRCDFFFRLSKTIINILKKVEKQPYFDRGISTTKAGQTCLKSIQFFKGLYVYPVKFKVKEFFF